MAWDEQLAERVRDVIGVRSGVGERRMFSALVWTIGGNMACGVRNDELIVRLEREEVERATAQPHVRPFETPNGRRMGGFVLVGAAALADDGELAYWAEAGADFAASLPPK